MAQPLDTAGNSDESSAIDQVIAEGGAYDVIRKRLQEQGRTLAAKTAQLNEARQAEFGQFDMRLAARVRVRTEHNCVARDIVQVGDYLLFAYNVFIGLKRDTQIADVFALFQLKPNGEHYDMESVPLDNSFLADRGFVNDFQELYRYYKHTRIVELTVKDGKLLAGFQIGERLEDVRVFRWAVSADEQTVDYIDNRGERDIQLPPAFDFEWVKTDRDDIVHGRHPHVNICDTVFVETLNGDLTLKIENNTEDGLGIYREAVEDSTQSLDDAEFCYAALGELILLRIRPYRETRWRCLVYNTLTQTVLRLDSIDDSCVQLPEDHGILFPGGYYLQSGEYKTFDETAAGLKFKRSLKSPNGEDILYVFYEPEAGIVGLFTYNLIKKQLQNPVFGHGYALSADGTLVIFAAQDEPTRIHPMQIWQTPYISEEHASQASNSQSFYGRIGNAELVRGISDLYSLCRLIDEASASVRLYEALSKAARKMPDAHDWMTETEAGGLDAVLQAVAATAELVMDEYEKVESIRQQSAQAMHEAQQTQTRLLGDVQPDNWQTAEEYAAALDRLRQQRGHLATLRDYRYMDQAQIDALDQALIEAQAQLGEQTGHFLAGEDALQPYLDKLDSLNQQLEQAKTLIQLQPVIETFETTAAGLDLLSELMASLSIQDATVRTRIIDAISEIYSRLNQSKAKASHKQKSLGSEEATAQFSAQFKLFSQSIQHALGMATTPEHCDEQLSRILVQLEELESQFSQYDAFLADIVSKREDVYTAFESHKQQLLDERQRQAQTVFDAASRILGNMQRRSLTFIEVDALNTYFASDALVLKTRELAEKLRALGDAVKADDIESRFKSIQEQAVRALRDKADIYEADGNVIKLGPRHKFSVNTQELDLTLLPREGALYAHLTGTDYYVAIEQPELVALQVYWDMALESETESVYRAEYLAYQVLQVLERQGPVGTLNRDQLSDQVKQFAAPRYQEGYEKGIHDHDAALILQQLVPVLEQADLLRYSPRSRALAQLLWVELDRVETAETQHETWPSRAQSAKRLRDLFASAEAIDALVAEVQTALQHFLTQNPVAASELERQQAAQYLVAELGRKSLAFVCSGEARQLVEALQRRLDEPTWQHYQATRLKLVGQIAPCWQLTTAWLEALVADESLDTLAHYVPEAVALIHYDALARRTNEAKLTLSISGLLGDHPNIQDQSLDCALDRFLQRLVQHQQMVIPQYRHYRQLRQQVIHEQREALRLDEFKPRPLSSFVRNRLINEAYLPIIGDNLAKQMGAVGDGKRSDLMGLLMMISPPGYGKTTLMEYIASRLGLIFMKINGPALGHSVRSLDPAQAPDATAAQELYKLNLALEMGQNVMLYLDDIQHTHAEFLQKFIALCDGTRRIEGIWQGSSKTYDMRGKKFCVVMAGNPYTESGEVFKVPDMLANRADIYNLGDVLSGMDEIFALSYIENCLTSNPVLAPLASRELSDVYTITDRAKGAEIALTDLSYAYSGAEINEITAVLRQLLTVQAAVLTVNQAYIQSAAQDDRYRTEPAFKLQGSYRNMNKMAEKVSAVMNDDELQQMILDHYTGEAQLLTAGAEYNLLKLKHLLDALSADEQARWEAILEDFQRRQAMGGESADSATKIAHQLVQVTEHLAAIHGSLDQDTDLLEPVQQLNTQLGALRQAIVGLETRVEVVNQPSVVVEAAIQAMADTVETTFLPAVASMDKKINLDLTILHKVADLSADLRNFKQAVVERKRRRPPETL